MSPHYIVLFFLRNDPRRGSQLLGGTVLCVTGAEAMFADLGQFSKRSIQIVFLSSIYPSLVLTYAGQTAYLIVNADDFGHGFYKFVPRPVYWPVFAIATLAAIVASQSLISATFSVVKQSVALDYFPRVRVVHTSTRKEGEVHSPETNYLLMLLCVGVVVGFGDAFGVVVILVMLITTVLLALVMLIIWGTHVVLVALYLAPFLVLEGTYVGATCAKILLRGWLPFAVSLALALVMFGWYYGRQRKAEKEMANRVTLDRLAELLADGGGVHRVPGFCFFYSNVQEWLQYLLVAKVDAKERVVVQQFGPRGVYGCTIPYGYADPLDHDEDDDIAEQVVRALRHHIERETPRPTRRRRSRSWRRRGRQGWCTSGERRGSTSAGTPAPSTACFSASTSSSTAHAAPRCRRSGYRCSSASRSECSTRPNAGHAPEMQLCGCWLVAWLVFRYYLEYY